MKIMKTKNKNKNKREKKEEDEEVEEEEEEEEEEEKQMKKHSKTKVFNVCRTWWSVLKLLCVPVRVATMMDNF